MSLGVNVATVSYDPVSTNKISKAEQKLEFHLLSDQNAETVNRLGIRNERYGEDSDLYGLSHPGIVLVDSEGTVLLKRAEEQYSNRPSFDELISAVEKALATKSTKDSAEEDSEEGVDTS